MSMARSSAEKSGNSRSPILLDQMPILLTRASALVRFRVGRSSFLVEDGSVGNWDRQRGHSRHPQPSGFTHLLTAPNPIRGTNCKRRGPITSKTVEKHERVRAQVGKRYTQRGGISRKNIALFCGCGPVGMSDKYTRALSPFMSINPIRRFSFPSFLRSLRACTPAPPRARPYARPVPARGTRCRPGSRRA